MLKLFCTSVVALTALTGIANAQDANEKAKKGAAAYQLCAACHSLQPGVRLSGPSLAKLWGKRAATISDFDRYTDALKKTEIVWDENTLYAWVADPQAMVPGTTMTFRGVENDETRANLIAFLGLALSPGGAAKVVKDGILSASMAQGQVPPDLSSLGPNQRITEIHHCHDAYHVTTANGAKFPFWETNVRLKIDQPTRPEEGRAGATPLGHGRRPRIHHIFKPCGFLLNPVAMTSQKAAMAASHALR